MSASTNKALALHSFTRPIVHIDCDAFFTSVEQALHPEYQGKPLVTGKERGIVACASYEAKALGVKRPMKLYEAKRQCPQLICLPSDYETYSLYSKRMMGIIREITPDVEEYSIDEAFADLSGLRRLYRQGYAEIAWKIKQTVQTDLGLTVSVGLSSSKILAKIASKENKPDGFTIFPSYKLHQILPKVALAQVCGFGPNTVALLEKRGMRCVWDYVCTPEAEVKRLLGKIGVELWHELRGEPVYPINTAEKDDYATISKCKTFTPASPDRDFVLAQLIRNFESAFIKLRRHHLSAKGFTVYLRRNDFSSTGLRAELERHTGSTMAAAGMIRQLFDAVFEPGTAYRLTGVVLDKVQKSSLNQQTLFEDPLKVASYQRIDRVIDEVNAKYGKHALSLGPALWLKTHKQHVNQRGDVAWRKNHLLKGETFRQRIGLPMLN